MWGIIRASWGTVAPRNRAAVGSKGTRSSTSFIKEPDWDVFINIPSRNGVVQGQAIATMKPKWLRIRGGTGEGFAKVKVSLKALDIVTVCEEAHCPNIPECWSSGTATFMVLGDICARGCRFCSVRKAARGRPLDPLEPLRIAKVVAEWGLDYAVITSVARDDLPDQGARHFAECVRAVKRLSPKTIIEVLTPDFRGDEECVRKVVEAGPEVYAHNIETTEPLQAKVRDRRANYWQSIGVLKAAKRLNPKIYTKSSIMLGLGELEEDVTRAMDDLRAAGVDIITFGQYLRPSPKHIEVAEYVPPERFEHYRKIAEAKGFLCVASGPFVRSSYRAGELFVKNILRRD